MRGSRTVTVVPAPGCGGDVEAAAGRDGALRAGGQADVALRDRVGSPLRAGPASVIGDDQYDGVRLRVQPQRDRARVRMPGGVGEQLAREREDELLLPRGQARLVDLDLRVGVGAARRRLGMGGQRGAQAGVVQDVGMQLEDLAAELVDSCGQRIVGAAVGVLVVAPMVVAQLVPGQQQVLDRLVVQHLGEASALAFLGGERLGEQPAALVGSRADPPIACTEQRRQHDGRRSGPREVQRVRDDRVEVRAGARRGMRQRDQHVGEHRRGRPCDGERRSQAERGDEREREERQPRLGVRAARGVRQRGDRHEVHDRLEARQARQPRQPTRRRQSVRDQQPDRPHADEGKQRPEQIAVGRPGPLHAGLPDRHERYQRHPQHRHPELGPDTLLPRRRGCGPLVDGCAHSSNPARIAAATAAARSETPSFS